MYYLFLVSHTLQRMGGQKSRQFSYLRKFDPTPSSKLRIAYIYRVSLREGLKKPQKRWKYPIEGGGAGNFENFQTSTPPFFRNGDFLILHVSWPEIARNGMKKIYPTGHIKKVGYFPTSRGGGGGGVSKKLEFSNFFFFWTLPLYSSARMYSYARKPVESESM